MPEETMTRPSGGSFIQKKAGPFPLWGWAVIVGSAFGIVIIVRRHQAPGTSKAVGQLAGTPSGSGVFTADPLTTQSLLSSIQDLTTTLQQIKQGGTTPPPGSLPITTFGGVTAGSPWSKGILHDQGIPIYDPNRGSILGWIPNETPLSVVGAAANRTGSWQGVLPDSGWWSGTSRLIPVNYLGSTVWISSTDISNPVTQLSSGVAPSITSGTLGGGLDTARAGLSPTSGVPGSGLG